MTSRIEWLEIDLTKFEKLSFSEYYVEGIDKKNRTGLPLSQKLERSQYALIVSYPSHENSKENTG